MLKRNYNMSDGDLISFIDRIILVIKSNISDFLVYNIDIDSMNELYNQLRAFDSISFDDDYLYSAVEKNQVKDRLKSSLEKRLREMLVRVEFKYGRDTPEYRNFNVSLKNLQTEDGLISVSRRTYLLLYEMLADLAEVGLTSAMLDEFLELINEFEEARNTKTKAFTERTEMTKERIIMANTLYNKMKTLCAIGRGIYKDNSYARYKVFKLPKRAPKGLDEPPVMNYNQEKRLVEWEKIDGATSYQLQINENKKFREIYSGIDTSFKLNVQKGWVRLRIRARNLKGFGPFSDVKDFWVG